MSKYYVLNGHETVKATLLEWDKWFEKADRTVDKTEIGDARVSTVFIGLDHSWDGGRPLLFETMVFGGPLDEEQERCSTWDEAVQQHAAMVARVTSVEAPGEPNGT